MPFTTHNFVALASRHTIETTGIKLIPVREQELGDTWRPEPTAALIAGVAYGPVNMIVRICSGNPCELADGFSGGVVILVEVTGPVSFYGELQTPGVDVPQLEVPLGRYRTRVSSLGADRDYDLAVTSPSQTFLVDFLPNDDHPAAI